MYNIHSISQILPMCFYVNDVIPCVFMKSLIMAVLPDPGGPTNRTFCPRAQANSISSLVRIYETSHDHIRYVCLAPLSRAKDCYC